MRALLALLFLACARAPNECPGAVGHCTLHVLGVCVSTEAKCCPDGSGPCPDGQTFTTDPLPWDCPEEPGYCADEQSSKGGTP